MRHSILLPFITMTLFLGAYLWVFAQADDKPIAQNVPARSPQPVSRILFGSCTKQNRPMPIFKTIAAQRPELFVFLGDNIYADTADMDVMRVEVRVGDARKLTGKIKESDHPCFQGIEERLAPGAVVVADNVGIGAAGIRDYLDHVRSKYSSKTEWFDIELPWGKRDAMEVTIIGPKGKSNR